MFVPKKRETQYRASQTNRTEKLRLVFKSEFFWWSIGDFSGAPRLSPRFARCLVGAKRSPGRFFFRRFAAPSLFKSHQPKIQGTENPFPVFLAEKVGFEPTQRANALRDFERLPPRLRSSLSVPFFTRFRPKTGQNKPNPRKFDRKLIENG